MAIYYIDYDTGADTNNGTSTSTPWKHCPGDSNATSNAASTTPVAGDTINFKGGVRYEGQVSMKASGTSGNVITYDLSPDGWGVSKGLMDGTSALSWNVCTAEGTGATEVNNPNFASIYYATLPANGDWRTPVFESDVIMAMAGTQTFADPFFNDDTDHWWRNTSGVTGTSIVDSVNFNQADANYWDGGIVELHKTGNSIGHGPVTGFNPATDTVTFASLGTPFLNSDSEYEYYIVNAQPQLTASGQYAVDEVAGIVYCWPSNIANVRVGSIDYGFHSNAKEYWTITGGSFIGHHGPFSFGRAITGSTSFATPGASVLGCDFYGIIDNGASGAVSIDNGSSADSLTISGCTFDKVQGRGLYIAGKNNVIQSNNFYTVSGTVIFSLPRNSIDNTAGLIQDNYIFNCRGVHANAISVYGTGGGSPLTASDWTLISNKVIQSTHTYGRFDFSAQAHHDFVFINNIFEGDAICDQIRAGGSYYNWFNNTVGGQFRIFSPANVTECILKNNVIGGRILLNTSDSWNDVEHDYNLFVDATTPTGLNWSLGANETHGTYTLDQTFTDYANSDWTLKSGSPAIDSGVDLSAKGYSDDIIDTSRPQGSEWDLSAYEFESGAAAQNNPKTGGRSSMLAMML